MLGILDDVAFMTTLDFKNEGDLIFLIGKQNNHIGLSEYLIHIHGIDLAPCPYFNLQEEFDMQSSLRAAYKKDLFSQRTMYLKEVYL